MRDSIAALNIQDAIIDGEVMAFDENWSPVKTGTGFFISPDGLSVTNFHVIQGASHLSGRTNEGAVFKFERVVAHPSGVDLAILKFAAEGVACLKLGHYLPQDSLRRRIKSASGGKGTPLAKGI